MKPVLQSFWIVVADRTTLQATCRYENVELARLEAQRLAKLNVGVRLYVFQMIGAAVVTDPVVWQNADNLPF